MIDTNGILLSNNGKTYERMQEISTCLMARDYKGFGSYGQTGVLEKRSQDN